MKKVLKFGTLLDDHDWLNTGVETVLHSLLRQSL